MQRLRAAAAELDEPAAEHGGKQLNLCVVVFCWKVFGDARCCLTEHVNENIVVFLLHLQRRGNKEGIK